MNFSCLIFTMTKKWKWMRCNKIFRAKQNSKSRVQQTTFWPTSSCLFVTFMATKSNYPNGSSSKTIESSNSVHSSIRVKVANWLATRTRIVILCPQFVSVCCCCGCVNNNHQPFKSHCEQQQQHERIMRILPQFERWDHDDFGISNHFYCPWHKRRERRRCVWP